MKSHFFKHNRFRIIWVVLAMLPLIWMGTRRTLDNIDNNIQDWLPSGFEETAQYDWFKEHFPNEQFVLMSWEGCNFDDPRLEQFAKRLVPSQSGLTYADDPVDINSSTVRSIRLNEDQPLEPGDVSKITIATPEPRIFKSVMTGPRLFHELKTRNPNLSDEEIYQRLEGTLIGKDHYKTCLVVSFTNEAWIQGKQLRKTLAHIKDLARECGIEPPIPAPKGNIVTRGFGMFGTVVKEMIFGRNPSTAGLIMGGPPVDNEAINYEGECTLWRLAGLCALVSLGISWTCFRSVRLTLIVFWIALLSAGISLAAVFFSGSTCDAIMLSMPALVLVLSMSGAIHIVNYYHDAIAEHGLDGATDRAVQHAWFPCTMAALTTALGLGSLCISHVVPISKFGIYSAIGVLGSLSMLFLYLPALLEYFPSKKFAEECATRKQVKPEETLITKWWRWFGGKVIRYNTAVSIGCAIVMVIAAAGLFQIRTSVKLTKMFADDAEVIAHYNWLEEHLGPLMPIEVVLTFDNKTCKLNTLERMRMVQVVEHAVEQQLADDVGGALSAATMVPDISLDQRTGLASSFLRRSQEYPLNAKLDEARPDLREYVAYEHVDRNPKLAEIGIPAALIPRLEDAGITHISDLLKFSSHKLTLPNTTEEQTAEINALVESWEKQYGKDVWRINARVWSLKKDIDYAAFVGDLRKVVDPIVAHYTEKNNLSGVDAAYTGIVPLVYKTQHELLKSLVESLTTAFLLICCVMMLVLRSPKAGMLSMIPNVFPVILVFGFMGWSGILIDIGTMMTSTVALGVAVDDTMHYLAWFREGLDRGLNRKKAAMAAYERCAMAMTQTTLIGGLGLVSFGFSTFTPTQRFGVLMLTILFTALIGDLVFLPALLTGRLGRFFDRWQKKPQNQGETTPDPDDTPDGDGPDGDGPSGKRADDLPGAGKAKGTADFKPKSKVPSSSAAGTASQATTRIDTGDDSSLDDEDGARSHQSQQSHGKQSSRRQRRSSNRDKSSRRDEAA